MSLTAALRRLSGAAPAAAPAGLAVRGAAAGSLSIAAVALGGLGKKIGACSGREAGTGCCAAEVAAPLEQHAVDPCYKVMRLRTTECGCCLRCSRSHSVCVAVALTISVLEVRGTMDK